MARDNRKRACRDKRATVDETEMAGLRPDISRLIQETKTAPDVPRSNQAALLAPSCRFQAPAIVEMVEKTDKVSTR